MSATSSVKYARLEGLPVRYTLSEAWVYADGEWKWANPVEVYAHAGVMTAEEFDASFGQLPALPTSAFHEGGNAASTGE